MVEASRILIILVKLFFSLLAIVGNGLVVVSCLKFDYLKQTSYVFVGFLATADLALGIGNPMDVALELVRPQITNETLLLWSGVCKTSKFIKLLGGFGDLAGIFGISLERFIFITYALNHEQILTKKRTIIIACVMATYSLLSSTLLIGFSKNFELGMVCQAEMVIPPVLNYVFNLPVFILVLPAIVMFYYKIARLAYSKRTRTSDIGTHNQNGGQDNQSGNWKITKVLCVVIGVFVLAYIPYTVAYISLPQNYWLLAGTALLWNVNTFVNPIIYGYKNKDFKKSF